MQIETTSGRDEKHSRTVSTMPIAHKVSAAKFFNLQGKTQSGVPCHV